MWSLLLAPAFASEQRLVYDLQVNGANVGSRTVTIRYMDRPNGNRRLVEATTRVSFAGKELQNRTVGQSGSRSATFSSQTSLNGERSQYQGVYMAGGGWEMTLAGGGKVTTQSWKVSDGVLTTLDMVDPGRTHALGEGGRAALFFVETGDVAAGTLGAARNATIQVGPTSIPVAEYSLALDQGGSATFAVDDGGLLVRSEVSWLGVRVAAVLREAPPERSYGTIDLGDLGVVADEPL